MSAEQVDPQEADLFSPPCLADVFDEALAFGSNALAVLSGSQEIGEPRRTEDGTIRRMLFCSRCSLVAAIEHDDDFDLLDLQPISQLRQDCRASEV